MKLQPPKNNYALVIRLLIENYKTGVTMKTAIADYLYKFNTRLGEIERSISTTSGNSRSLKLKVDRVPITVKNRFGHSCTFLNYKPLAEMSYLLNLYDWLNSNKFKK